MVRLLFDKVNDVSRSHKTTISFILRRSESLKRSLSRPFFVVQFTGFYYLRSDCQQTTNKVGYDAICVQECYMTLQYTWRGVGLMKCQSTFLLVAFSLQLKFIFPHKSVLLECYRPGAAKLYISLRISCPVAAI